MPAIYGDVSKADAVVLVCGSMTQKQACLDLMILKTVLSNWVRMADAADHGLSVPDEPVEAKQEPQPGYSHQK